MRKRQFPIVGGGGIWSWIHVDDAAAATVLATEARAASNGKLKRKLGRTPHYPSWRQGFPAVYSAV